MNWLRPVLVKEDTNVFRVLFFVIDSLERGEREEKERRETRRDTSKTKDKASFLLQHHHRRRQVFDVERKGWSQGWDEETDESLNQEWSRKGSVSFIREESTEEWHEAVNDTRLFLFRLQEKEKAMLMLTEMKEVTKDQQREGRDVTAASGHFLRVLSFSLSLSFHATHSQELTLLSKAKEVRLVCMKCSSEEGPLLLNRHQLNSNNQSWILNRHRKRRRKSHV